MKAIIHVGGYAPHLCPLTLKVQMPFVDFANKPLILHQIEALKEVGVTEVVLASYYQPEIILDFLKEFEVKLGIRITCSQVKVTLGSYVLRALAGGNLLNCSGEPFFVLNCNNISEYPFAELVEFHKSHGGEATIMVTKVDEPSEYDVVVIEEETGRVERFVEKTEIFVGNMVNAGIYLLNPSVLDEIEIRVTSKEEDFPTSIEKKVFSKLVLDQKFYAMVLSGFWMEIKLLNDYLKGLRLYLNSIRNKSPSKLAFSPHVIGNVLVDESASIGEGCSIGPNVTIGSGCVVESNVRLSSCMVMRGAHIKKCACISNSIIGWHSTVGQWSRLDNMTIIGQNVHVGDDLYINGCMVFPNKKKVESNMLKPGIYSF